jgi:hypothetical protein
MSRFAPQHLYERHEKSVLYVVVARNPKRSLSAGWIEYAACDETLAVGEQLLQRNGQRLCPRCRQQAALSAYEQGVAQEVAQARQHATDRRLCVAQPRGCSCDVALIEQSIEHDQQVEGWAGRGMSLGSCSEAAAPHLDSTAIMRSRYRKETARLWRAVKSRNA